MENLIRNEIRWKNTKFYPGFAYLLDSLERYKGIEKLLPPIREWKGNYQADNFIQELPRIFSIRKFKHENIFLEKEPLKHKRYAKRVRGYTDQGSESSESVRARRRANAFATEEELQQAYNRELAKNDQLQWLKLQFTLRHQRE
jgi:hypothetical protein